MNKTILSGSFAALCLFLSACEQSLSPVTDDTVSGRPVKLLTVQEANKHEHFTLPAVIQARASAQMAFQIGGKLDKPLIKEGTEVTAGTELARLEQQEFQNRLDTAQAQFDSARDEYERTRRLIKTNAVSKSMLEQRRTQYEVARASLNTAQKNFTDSVLRAPFNGVVSDVNVEAFQSVGPQQTILTIQSVGMSDAIIQVPADFVIYSKQYDFKNLTVQLDAAPDIQLEGTLGPYMATTDTGSQSYQAKIHFTPPQDLIVLPGMTGEVHIELVKNQISAEDTGITAVTVPLNAIGKDKQGTYVWKLNSETMTVTRQAITLAVDNIGANLKVVEGLSAGDEIAVSGVNSLLEGMSITRFTP